jgi:hypothetical protein
MTVVTVTYQEEGAFVRGIVALDEFEFCQNLMAQKLVYIGLLNVNPYTEPY